MLRCLGKHCLRGGGEVSAAAWAFVAIGCIGLIWVVLWQFKKWSELDERLARADPSLLDDAALSSEEAIQAPAGSVILPYTLAVDIPLQTPLAVTSTTQQPYPQPYPQQYSQQYSQQYPQQIATPVVHQQTTRQPLPDVAPELTSESMPVTPITDEELN